MELFDSKRAFYDDEPSWAIVLQHVKCHTISLTGWKQKPPTNFWTTRVKAEYKQA